jgi:hypothetical protein
MVIEDKINLLTYLVPRFGTGNPEQEEALTAFAAGLKPVMEIIRGKCPDFPESDVELLGSEMLACEIVVPGRSTKEEFAAWVGSMNGEDLKGILAVRKSFNEEAKSELYAFRNAQTEEENRREELKKEYEETVKKAREERSMAFNPNTGKFQEINKKK